MSNDYLVPYPQAVKIGKNSILRPKQVCVKGAANTKAIADFLKKDLKDLAKVKNTPKGFPLQLQIKKSKAKAESYILEISKKGIKLTAPDEAGLFYGVQTLLQIFVLGDQENLSELKIEDWPQFRTRSFMIDLGRTVFSFKYLQRIVRMISRLKMNALHLHLCDDQLGGLRYKKLPFGSENPGAITLAELKKLVEYARTYQVKIIPEIECWGHAGSMIYHYPELYGAPGMWGGMSFAIGEKLFEILEKVFDELLPCLEKKCEVHIGLDEAIWALAKDVPKNKEKDYTPTTLTRRLHDILRKSEKKAKRKVTIHLWADHGGRPLPKGIEKNFVIQPWMYFEAREDDIKAKVKKYSGKNKGPFMMGGGMSSNHFGGHFGATRAWCQAGKNSPNVEGITICHWENNNIADQLVGLFGGADYAWTPETPKLMGSKVDTYNEYLRAQVTHRMKAWQVKFKDGDEEALQNDMGSVVSNGFYCWGKKAGKAVAPTAWMKMPGQRVGGADMDM